VKATVDSGRGFEHASVHDPAWADEPRCGMIDRLCLLDGGAPGLDCTRPDGRELWAEGKNHPRTRQNRARVIFRPPPGEETPARSRPLTGRNSPDWAGGPMAPCSVLCAPTWAKRPLSILRGGGAVSNLYQLNVPGPDGPPPARVGRLSTKSVEIVVDHSQRDRHGTALYRPPYAATSINTRGKRALFCLGRDRGLIGRCWVLRAGNSPGKWGCGTGRN